MDIIYRVLRANGFDDKFCDTVMFCVWSVSFSVLLNESLLLNFRLIRGLHQGDPLSPYQFILCLEVHSKLIDKEQVPGHVHGVRIAYSPIPINHLMFVNDTFLFCKDSLNEVEALMRCVAEYESWSGQRVSREKSRILFSPKCPHEIRRSIFVATGFHVLRGDEVYLGNPLFLSRNHVVSFTFLRDKVRRWLEGWKARLLSWSGRVTMIEAVVQNVPI